MLTAMHTFDASPLGDGVIDGPVVTAFEACAGFVPGGDGSPACLACGWLDAEHSATRDAEVRRLAPRRLPSPGISRRLAS
jgi:hypothetical protein